MGDRVYQVDAFAAEPFAGNPAAVVLLEREAEAGWMQRVAMEMNLSETAFVRRLGEGNRFELRWFTPSVEVELCGHGTLATAAALWEAGWLEPEQAAEFETLYSGRLTARRAAGRIAMDFPARRTELMDDAAARSLGFDWKPMLGEPIVRLGRAADDLLVEMTDAAAVRRLRPDLTLLSRLPVRGIIVTAKADADEAEDYDFISRFFAPAAGVAEDPVTGSAHCALGPWWAQRLERRELVGYQASRRGGRVNIDVAEDRVTLGGEAVIVMEGRLRV